MSLDFSLEQIEPTEVYSRNITHNLIPMWKLAGVDDALYGSNGKKAESVIEVLRKGLKDMQDRPKEYEKLNPQNGWGDYEGAKQFLEDVIDAVGEFSDATIRISK